MDMGRVRKIVETIRVSGSREKRRIDNRRDAQSDRYDRQSGQDDWCACTECNFRRIQSFVHCNGRMQGSRRE